jgi:hypothetical protein
MPLPGDKDRIVANQEMVATLNGYRETERNPAMRANYLATIDRLESLAYRLTQREPPVVIRPRPPAPAPEQPVGAIVRTRKPKRR